MIVIRHHLEAYELASLSLYFYPYFNQLQQHIYTLKQTWIEKLVFESDPTDTSSFLFLKMSNNPILDSFCLKDNIVAVKQTDLLSSKDEKDIFSLLKDKKSCESKSEKEHVSQGIFFEIFTKNNKSKLYRNIFKLNPTKQCLPSARNIIFISTNA